MLMLHKIYPLSKLHSGRVLKSDNPEKRASGPKPMITNAILDLAIAISSENLPWRVRQFIPGSISVYLVSVGLSLNIVGE